MEGQLLTLTEAVRVTTIKRTTLLKMVYAGEFKGVAFKLGSFRDWRFDRAELQRWMEQQKGKN